VTGSPLVKIAKWIEWVALAALPILTAMRAAGPPTKPVTTLGSLYAGVVGAYLPLMIAFSVLALLGKVGQAYLGPESKIRVKAILDALDEACFAAVPANERYYNRVTLFKANRKKTKLGPYCRAGQRYQRRIPSFQINNDDESQNEGLGGQAWFRNATVTVNDLPVCPNKWSDDDAQCKEYARLALLTDSRVPGIFDAARETTVRIFTTALSKML
jgi:hypothetical protein